MKDDNNKNNLSKKYKFSLLGDKFHKQWVKLALLIILINIAKAVKEAVNFSFDRLTAVVLQGYSPFWIQTRSSDLWYSGVDKSNGIAIAILID